MFSRSPSMHSSISVTQTCAAHLLLARPKLLGLMQDWAQSKKSPGKAHAALASEKL